MLHSVEQLRQGVSIAFSLSGKGKLMKIRDE